MNRYNINNVSKIIREMLIRESGLNEQYVRNALSMYGSYMSDSYSESIWKSLTPNQSLIFFEISDRDNDSDMSEKRSDGYFHIFSSYQVHIIIYGDNAENLSNTLLSRIRGEVCRDWCLSNDIYLEKISNATSVNEYKNGVLWERNDFDIDIGTEIKIAPASNDYIFSSYSDIIVKTKEVAESNV